VKKLITLVVILVIILGGWWKYSSYVKEIKQGVQGDPVRTVNSFMNTAVKFSNLFWNEEEREAFRRELEEWKKQSEEGEEEASLESFKEYGLKDPSHLFKNSEYGKAVATILCFFQFDSYSIEKTEIEEDSAKIEVKFLPQDFMGIGKIMAEASVPQRERKKKPVSIPFHLKKHRHRCYIVGIKGELERFTEATYRLRQYR